MQNKLDKLYHYISLIKKSFISQIVQETNRSESVEKGVGNVKLLSNHSLIFTQSGKNE